MSIVKVEEALKLALVDIMDRQGKPVGIIITDKDTHILYVNKGFTEITQYKEEDAKGQTPKILKSGLYTSSFYKLMWRSLKKKKRWQGMIWDRRKNGSLYLSFLEIQVMTNHTGEVDHYYGRFIELDGLWEVLARFIPIPEFEERVLLPSLAEGKRKNA